MSDSDRQAWIEDAVEVLRRYWLRHPDLRLAQIVGNAATERKIPQAYYMGDAEFFYALGLLEGRELQCNREPDT